MPNAPASTDDWHYTYQEPPTVPTLHIRVVATGDVVMDPVVVPQWVKHDISTWAAQDPRAVLVLDLGDARWEAETLLRTLTSAASGVEGLSGGDVVIVVTTRQPGVAQIARMVASYLDVPMYIADSPAAVADAIPVGRLTTTEQQTLEALRQLGGRATAITFAAATSLKVTAAGNRLSSLARRGYVNRVSRSRRDGDEFVTPAWFEPGR